MPDLSGLYGPHKHNLKISFLTLEAQRMLVKVFGVAKWCNESIFYWKHLLKDVLKLGPK